MFGMAGALFAAACYGIASTLQAVAARSTKDERHGVDPRLLVRLLAQRLFLASLVFDGAGLFAQINALRLLPLFLVQAALASCIAVTAVTSVRWCGTRLSWVEWTAVAAVCVGLALLGLSAAGQGDGRGGPAFHLGLLVGVMLLVLAGLAAGRLPNGPRTAVLGLLSGLSFGALGIGVRVLPDFGASTLVSDPATYAAIVAGLVGGWFYTSALQRGGVVAATAMMLVGETIPPSIVGVLLLGDQARPGWEPVALAGFVIAVAGAITLARFGDVGRERAEDAPVGVGVD